MEIDFAHLRISNSEIFFLVITTWKTSSCRREGCINYVLYFGLRFPYAAIQNLYADNS
jgi:hypothetical protein